NAPNLIGEYNIDDEAGYCHLGLNNTNITSITGTRPVNILSLTNNINLNKNKIIKVLNGSQGSNFPATLIPMHVNLSGSNNMLCSNVNNKKSLWETHPPTDMTKSYEFVIKGEVENSPLCFSRIVSAYISPDICQPNKILVENISIYKDPYRNKFRFNWTDNQPTVTEYQIMALDINGNELGATRSYEQSTQLPIHINYEIDNIVPKKFKLRACSYLEAGAIWKCGDWSEGKKAELSPARVTYLESKWNNISPSNQTQDDNNKHYIHFDYSQTYIDTNFVNNGKFKIWKEGESAIIETIPYSVSPDGFSSGLFSRHQYEFDTIMVKACINDTIENQEICGSAFGVTVSDAPIATTTPNQVDHALIPEAHPSLSECNSGTNTIKLNIYADDANGLDPSLVDYFKVIEQQPVAQAIDFATPSRTTISYAKEVNRATAGVVSSIIKLKRQVNGGYKFTISACHKNEGSRDSCSESKWISNGYDCTINNPLLIDVVPANSLKWYSMGVDSVTGKEKKVIKWNYTGTNKPDYFYIRKTGSQNTQNNTANAAINACGNKRNVSTDVTIVDEKKYSKYEFGHYFANEEHNHPLIDSVFDDPEYWSTRMLCSEGIQVDDSAVNEWDVYACQNGIGCTVPATININDTNSGGMVDPPVGPTSTHSQTTGGPGAVNPGLWWNPYQSGTGWHFYWVNNIKGLSDTETLSKPYDLKAYWLTYKSIDGIWSPVWLTSNLINLSNVTNGEIYKGSIDYQYMENGNLVKVNSGSIELIFYDNGSNLNDNKHVKLLLDIDYSGSLFSQNQVNYDSVAQGIPEEYRITEDGKIEIPLEDFAITSINGNPIYGDQGNDLDHYTGAWNNANHLPESNNKAMTVLTWIEREFELMDILFYDDEENTGEIGEPLWVQAQSCGTSCPVTADWFPNNTNENFYTVSKGFNPLGYAEVDYNASTYVEYLATAQRNLAYVDTNITGSQFNQLQLDFHIDVSSANQNSTDLNGRNAQINVNNAIFDKIANVHSIEYYLTNSSGTEIIQGNTCDPNEASTDGECVIHFNWFTTDDFPTVRAYYKQYIDGVVTEAAPLADLCGDDFNSTDPYSQFNFQCLILDAGTYQFELRKQSYTDNSQTIAIAESEQLTVLACDSAACDGEVLGIPAVAPEPIDYTGSISADSTSDTVGTTAGAFDIDESGSANYSLPIFAPAGRGGLAPQMALSYNSSAGNGIAGVGWNISGTSSITRCLKSPEHDPDLAYYPTLQMNDEDALCIDGQRMFKLGDGSYRTEIDSFSRITPIGTVGNGPNKFKVETKSGEIRVYGSPGADYIANKIFSTGGTGAQVISNTGNSSTVHTWLLSKIQDKNGNNIHFLWDTLDGENYLSYVRWTNPSGVTNSHHYEIEFEYSDSRVDAMHHYGIGTEYKGLRNLEWIRTLIRPSQSATTMQEVRRLNLTYQAAANPTGMLRLSSIVECVDDGDTCLEPVEFEWDEGINPVNYHSGTVYASTSIGELANMGYGSSKFIDINGDGIQELMFVRNYDDGGAINIDLEARFEVAYTRETNINNLGCDEITDVESLYAYICNTDIKPYDLNESFANGIRFDSSSWFVYDFNGDGYEDIVSVHQDDSSWFIYYSNGSKICKYSTGSCSGYAPKNTNIPMVYQYHNNNEQISKDYNAGLLTLSEAQILMGNNETVQTQQAHFADITNDGLPELIQYWNQFSENNVIIYSLTKNSQNKLTFVEQPWLQADSIALYFSDALCDPGVSNCLPSNILPPGTLKSVIDLNIQPSASDFNGDGYSDFIIEYTYNNSEIGCIYNCIYTRIAGVFSAEEGDYGQDFKLLSAIGFVEGEYLQPTQAHQIRAMDINGDGLSDVVYRDRDQYLNPSNSLDWKYQINQGLNENGTIKFSPIKSFNLESIGNHRNDKDDNFTSDENGRIQKVTFFDYDNDGDIDILYPENHSQSSAVIKYRLRKYDTLSPYSVLEPAPDFIVGTTSTSMAKNNTLFRDIDGDGHMDYLRIVSGGNNLQRIRKASNPKKSRNKITKIINQLDNQQTHISIDYMVATNSDVYTKSTGSLELSAVGNGSPVFDIFAPTYLVRSVYKTAPGFNDTEMEYSYSGLKVQAGGRGSLGFETVTTHDTVHDMTTTTSYYQNFPLTGMAESTISEYSQGAIDGIISESMSTYAVHETTIGNKKTYFPYLSNSIEKEYALNAEINAISGALEYTLNSDIGDAQKTIINTFTYNNNGTDPDIAHGNLSSSKATTCDGDAISINDCTLVESKATVNVYDDDEDKWLLGRLSNTTVTTTRKINGQDQSKVRTSSFEYDDNTGQLIKEMIAGNADQQLMTLYVHDSYGQIRETYQCSSHFSTMAACKNTAGMLGRPISQENLIQRYTKQSYDIWDEYVDKTYEPFSSYTGNFNLLSDSGAQLYNNLDQGSVAEENVSTVISRDIYGNATLVEDMYGNQSATAYGEFGDAYTTATSIGSMNSTTKRWCSDVNSQCPFGVAANIVVKTTQAGGANSRKYIDILGREVRSQAQDFNGDWITVDTFYDQLGRTIKQSEPYIRSGANNSLVTTQYYTHTQYDALDRVMKITLPQHCQEDITDDSQSCIWEPVVTITKYQGLTVSVTNPLEQTTTQTFDASGKIISSKDTHNKAVNYQYDANGNLQVTTGPLSTITMTYDDLGRKSSMDDPDKGIWTYRYNALGEMIEQTHNSTTQKSLYDVRGRMFYRGSSNGDEVSLWEYDAVHKGLMAHEYSVSGHDPTNNNTMAQAKDYLYDAYKRPSEVITTVYDGEQTGVRSYTTSSTYDQYGRVFQSFDATGNGVLYQYNDYGYQYITRDAANGTDGQIYHQVLDTDARGNVISEKLYDRFHTYKTYDDKTGFLQTIKTNSASGLIQDLSYAFDSIGHLIRRSDFTTSNSPSVDHLTETFEYDNLNRLKAEFLDYQINPESSYAYDLLGSGNLIQKDDVALSYDKTNSAGPHAVTSASNGKSYQYDSVGNVVRRLNGSVIEATFKYTSFDKPYEMAANGWQAQISYGANRSRYLRKDINLNGGERKVTHYLGSVEYIYETNKPVKAKRYIGNLVITIDNDSNSRQRWDFNYLLKDHIGSTHTITNRFGNVISQMSFNAWGQRRHLPSAGNNGVIPINQVWNFNALGGLRDDIEATTNRGFTGHEHFDQVGIIHMNGRIYDPTIGRFLQADPIIQDPYNTQSLNRYSYVMNNPLSYTDPTGYSRLRKGVIFNTVATIVISVFLPGSTAIFGSSVQAGATLFSSAVTGTVVGAINAGNLKGAVKGGIFASITFGIGHGFKGFDGKAGIGEEFSRSRIFAHALVSGVSAEVDGGSFGHGFSAAVLSQNIGKNEFFKKGGSTGRIVSNAILQGTISEVTGGKFANGAMSAAFRVAFND
ncbi:MAG: hypothetical protein JKY19_08495, partial [Alcanivoracaceae bacterium]|nr:hypothetical protein [Alcanivoracaceae bacterium]